MFRKLFFSIFSICFLFGALTYAQTYLDPNEDLATLEYKKTMDLCSQKFDQEGNSTFNWDMWSLVKYGAVASFKLVDPDSMQLSKPVRDLINSRGYQAALDECYGPAEFSRWAYIEHKAFTVAVVSADAGGHLAGLLGWMLPMEAFGRIFMASRFALANPGLVRAGAWTLTAANRVGIAAVAAYASWDTYKNYELRKHAKEYFEESNNRMIDTTRQEMDESYVMVENKLAEVNGELARGVSDPQRLQFLLAKKAQLEDRLRTRNEPPVLVETDVGPK